MRKFAFVFLLGWVFFACGPEPEEGGGQTEIRLSSSVNMHASRALQSLTDAHIGAGEQVAVWVDDALTNTEIYGKNLFTADGSGGLAGDKIYFPADGSGVDIYALHTNAVLGGAYPASELTHTVASDQRTLSAYVDSDLLYAIRRDVAKTTSEIPLTFQHLLSKLQVAIVVTDGLAAADIESVAICGTKLSAKFTLAKDAASSQIAIGAVGEASAIAIGKEVTADVAEPNFNDVIIVPQSVAAGTVFVYVRLASGAELTCELDEGMLFESSRRYECLVAVSPDGLELSTSVADWEPKERYNVVGDTRAYPFKLNVVYFVPTNQTANADYRERLSTILLNYQLFICKWMEHWGHGSRSFGLPLAENGMVDIVTVAGADPLSGYPRGATSAQTIKAEIEAHYAAQNITPHSNHYMVFIAVNTPSHTDVPISGSGQWAVAPDYLAMRQDNIAAHTGYSGNAIGDAFHEMLHALNGHHVGPSASQFTDSRFGTAMMGVGNWYYGRQSTFIHEATAATLLTSQVCQVEDDGRTWYDWSSISGQVQIGDPTVTIDGGNCTVSGTFTSNKRVNHVIVRFFNSKETLLVGSENYDCFGAVAPVTGGNSYSVTFPISDLRYTGYQSGSGAGSVTTFKMGVTILNSNGTYVSKGTGTVYTRVYQNGVYTLEASASNVSRDNWVVTTSHALPEPTGSNGDLTNVPRNLADGNQNTLLTVVKPGMTYKGVTVPANETTYVQIDMGSRNTFNTAVLSYRMYNTHVTWRAKKVSFYQSDDEVNFTFITQAELDTAAATSENVIDMGETITCRYLRMTYDEWDTASGDAGGAMMFRELNIETR